MSIEQSYRVTLKTVISEEGVFESIRLMKGRSTIDEEMIAKINNVLQDSFVPKPPVRTTVAIGEDAEQQVMHQLNVLSRSNMDFEVVDTSDRLNHGDMMIIHQDKRICVEVKCYTKPVPIQEIEKYAKSLAHIEYDAGIMIQMNDCGYARQAGIRTPIDFRIVDKKPSVYLTGVDLSILYPVINMIIVFLEANQEIDQDELELKRKALLQIHEKIVDMRVLVENQKKLIARMESSIDDIAKLSLV
jgi:hypothetical protein